MILILIIQGSPSFTLRTIICVSVSSIATYPPPYIVAPISTEAAPIVSFLML
jgi:hypothetical protein